jgi:hypothetical protein
MSVRTFDPKPREIYPTALCTAGCGQEYYSICRHCNLAYCFDHLKLEPHVCDTKSEFFVLTEEEAFEPLFHALEVGCIHRPKDWDESPKGCFSGHPKSRAICQLPPDGHEVHKRAHPNGTQLEFWVDQNGKARS